MEGRHVGLDFYDLLIEVVIVVSSISLIEAHKKAKGKRKLAQTPDSNTHLLKCVIFSEPYGGRPR